MYESEFVKRARPETLRGYRYSFTTFSKLVPEMSIDHISPTVITKFFKILQERKRLVGKGVVKTGVKKSTIASYWTKLNVFFDWLVNKRHIIKNPFDELPYPVPSYDNKKYLHKEEIEKIFTAIFLSRTNDLLLFKRNLVLFHLLLFCGLRKEELLHLQVRDVDLERKLLTIRAETSKSGASRQIPIHSTTYLHLVDYLQERKKHTTPFLIISTGRDDKLSYHGLKHLVEKMKQLSGVSFHLHQFRHTFAMNFLKSTGNIFKLKTLLGHKSILATTVYLRCMPPEELRRDIESVNIDTFM